MNQIDLQKKTSAKNGVIEIFLSKNENEDLEKTIFHRMYIPLEAFSLDSDDDKLEETEIVIDWLDLNLKSDTNLDGLTLKTTPKDESQISIMINHEHIPCDIDKMVIKKTDTDLYQVECHLFVDFEFKKMAKNEVFNFVTQMQLDPQIKE